MIYIECRTQDCSFLITRQDEYCPNCGVPQPHLHTAEDYFTSVAFNPGGHAWLFAITFVVVFALAGVILLMIADNIFLMSLASIFLLAVIIAIISVLGGFALLKNAYVDSLQLNEFHNPNLKQVEHIAHQRLSEIKEQGKRIDVVLLRVKQNRGEQWNVARQRLEGAKNTLKLQRTRYNIKLLEVETVRWQNKIAALIEELDVLTFEEYDSRLKTIDAMHTQGTKIRAGLISQQHEFDTTLEMKRLLERIDETLKSCQKIHEALLGRQAVIALEEVTPLRDAVLSTATPLGALKSLEALNIQIAITDFSLSFEELETEYLRMKGEEDFGQQVKYIVEKAEGAV